jgi:hypothetical protein
MKLLIPRSALARNASTGNGHAGWRQFDPSGRPNNDARQSWLGIKLHAETGPVVEARDDRRDALEPFPFGAGRAKQDAAGPRRRLRTPPSRNARARPMPPRRSGWWTLRDRDRAGEHHCAQSKSRRTDAFWSAAWLES